MLEQLVRLPRLIRVLIVAVFSLVVALAVSPLIDHIYIRFFFSSSTVILPSLVTVAVGSIVYIIGWRIYIGTVNTTPPAENRILWYFGIGAVVTIFVLGLIVYGVISLNLPIESA